jgi:hypothetical protein
MIPIVVCYNIFRITETHEAIPASEITVDPISLHKCKKCSYYTHRLNATYRSAIKSSIQQQQTTK